MGGSLAFWAPACAHTCVLSPSISLDPAKVRFRTNPTGNFENTGTESGRSIDQSQTGAVEDVKRRLEGLVA
jgi:hypothetical protein